MGQLLKGKICIVTGGSRGIGRAISETFASQGAYVYSVGSKLSSFDDWILDSKFKSTIIPMGFDIRDSSLIRELMLLVKKSHGKIDVLVNNAGVEYNEVIGMISSYNMHEMFDVNVYATIEFLQLASRIMSSQSDGGSIINISSIVGIKGNKGQLSYSATKGAVIALTKSAAKELASKNIRVNSIAPGLTRTGMIDDTDYDKLKDRISNIGMGRLAEPLDIANACVFLASDLSSYISGQIIGVDGCSIM